MLRHLIAAAAALAVTPVLAAPPAATPGGALHAVVNIDVMPSDEAAGSALVAAFVRHARQDPAIRSIVLIQQSGTPNHFILDESFVDGVAYHRFIQSPAFRDFRATLYPHLGSPWDERLGDEVAR